MKGQMHKNVFITRRFVVVSSQGAEKIKRLNEGGMGAH